MKTLLLHLGFPKTGTTTLQGTLFQNAPDLNFFAKSIRNGKEYVPDSVETFRTLINYGTAFHVQNRANEVLDDMVAAMATEGQDRVLLSLEGLTNPFVDTNYTQPKDIFRKASDIRRVVAPLIDDGVEVKILVTVRKQSELIPSLFSQIYLQGFSSGLFGPSYESFLEFMLNDNIMGFGPDFQYDAFLDHCATQFGAENVYAASMKGVLSHAPCRDMAALAAFMDLSEDDCIALIGDGKLNVRNKGKRKGRRMMVTSRGAIRFQKNTGLSVLRKAFSVPDQLRIKRGTRVHWHLADHSQMIDAYYTESNSRLAEKYDITF
jgi:hypothetical protein